MLIGNSANSPTFLKAKTPELLRDLMLSNNIKNGTEFYYFDIQFVKNYWYAWYKFDFSRLVKSNGKSLDNG